MATIDKDRKRSNNRKISEEALSTSSDIFEFGFDSLIENGTLKDFPVIGSLFGISKTYIAIKEKLFREKILRFLKQLESIPIEEKKAFSEKIQQDEKYKTKVNETLLLVLDQLDDYSKSDYIGKLFAATINKKIDYDTFLKLSNIINKSFIPDLNNLVPIYNGNIEDVDDVNKDTLYGLGLLANLGIDGRNLIPPLELKVIPNKKNQLDINKYGKLIVQLILQPDESEH